MAVTLPRGRTSPSHTPLKRKPDARLRPKHIRRAGGVREHSPAGDMIGVNVGIDHEVDFHAGILRDLKVGSDIANGVDDRRRCLAAAAEQVGDADRVIMQELTDK